MSAPKLSVADRTSEFCRVRGISLLDHLGKGKDGGVWLTSAGSALKIHERPESYQHEVAAYIRFLSLGLEEVAGFAIPILLGFDDELLAIEMAIVTPPFVVDFASARLDLPDDLIEDEGNTLEDLVRERFGEQADQVMAIHFQLATAAGVFLTDLHPHNIKLGN
jgi:hypothetical protein